MGRVALTLGGRRLGCVHRGSSAPSAECGGVSPHFFILYAGDWPARDNMSLELESVVKHELDALGYDLVLLRRGGTRSRPLVEIRIDRRDGERVSVSDCARASRAIEARFDADAATTAFLGGGRYELQVSSPGDARRGTPGAPPGTASGAGMPQRPAVNDHTGDGSRDGWVG